MSGLSAESSISCPSKASNTPPLLDLPFDFLNAEEVRPLAIHDVELRRAENRHRRRVAHDVTPQDFAALHGITIEDTRDPISRVSCLEFDSALREYYGDPEDDAYVEFVKNLTRVLNNDSWLKGNDFLGKDIADDYTRLKRFEDDALQLLGTSEDIHIAELEDYVYSEVHSSAHREFLQQYREEKCPDQILLRLALEQNRRYSDALGEAASVDIPHECLTIRAPRQRQWKGKLYKRAFLGLCKDEAAPHMLE